MNRADLTPHWYDWVAVRRALDGRPVGRALHHAERVEVARGVVADGDGYNRLMAILNCNGKTAKQLIAESARTAPRRVPQLVLVVAG